MRYYEIKLYYDLLWINYEIGKIRIWGRQGSTQRVAASKKGGRAEARERGTQGGFENTELDDIQQSAHRAI